MCVYTKMVLEIGYAHQLSTWGYAISHAALLLRFKPTTTQPFYAYQMVTGYEQDVSLFTHI